MGMLLDRPSRGLRVHRESCQTKSSGFLELSVGGSTCKLHASHELCAGPRCLAASISGSPPPACMCSGQLIPQCSVDEASRCDATTRIRQVASSRPLLPRVLFDFLRRNQKGIQVFPPERAPDNCCYVIELATVLINFDFFNYFDPVRAILAKTSRPCLEGVTHTLKQALCEVARVYRFSEFFKDRSRSAYVLTCKRRVIWHWTYHSAAS